MTGGPLRERHLSGLPGRLDDLPAVPREGLPEVRPYQVLHWAALAGCIGFAAWLIVLIAAWHSEWSGIPQVIAAALGIAGCTLGLSWLKERELNLKVITQWQQQHENKTSSDTDVDWEVGN